MALNTLPAGAFADNAITSDKINLANNFAFTGTVSGASDVVLLKTQTISTGVASVDFVHGTDGVVFDNTYSVYEVHGIGLDGATAGAEIFGQVTDGSSFKTSGYRSITNQSKYDGSSASAGTARGQTDGIELLRDIDSNANETAYFRLTIPEPYTNSYQIMYSFSSARDNTTTANITLENSACFYNANIIATGVRIIANSGNIDGGVYKLYGFK